MEISVITLFPELYEPFLKASLIGRAQQKKIINSHIVSLFDFAKPKERIDSPSFGHGAGMLIKPEVIEKVIDSQEQKYGKAFKIFFSPQGKKLDQKLLKSIYNRVQEKKHILLVSSRYEGMDSRVEQYYADEIISVGDFVLMGGDLPAMCFIEAFSRLIPEVVGKQESVEHESFSGPFVDYPEFTAPTVWKNLQVPEVIKSGNHAAIDKWRKEQAAKNTVKNHFDWLRSYSLTKEQIELAQKFIPDHYAVLMHSEVMLKDNKVGTTSVTSLDIHDIARSCSTYGLKNYYISTPLQDQQKVVQTLLDFWQTGFGLEYNESRAQAVKKVKLKSNLEQVISDIYSQTNKKPIVIATSAKKNMAYKDKYINYYNQSKIWQEDRPVLFIFGTGYGLSPKILENCDFILEPVYGFSSYNHLSVRSAAAIILDRWLGISEKD